MKFVVQGYKIFIRISVLYDCVFGLLKWLPQMAGKQNWDVRFRLNSGHAVGENPG